MEYTNYENDRERHTHTHTEEENTFLCKCAVMFAVFVLKNKAFFNCAGIVVMVTSAEDSMLMVLFGHMSVC